MPFSYYSLRKGFAFNNYRHKVCDCTAQCRCRAQNLFIAQGLKGFHRACSFECFPPATDYLYDYLYRLDTSFLSHSLKV